MLLSKLLDSDDCLSIREGVLHLEGCSLQEIASRFGTPLNVVSEERLRRRAREYQREFENAWPQGPVQVLASIKANYSLALRRILTQEGMGCDTFGENELHAAMTSGVPPRLISLNGSSKSSRLLKEAFRKGVHVTLDSVGEVEKAAIAASELGMRPAVRLRLRPDFSSASLPSEFGDDGDTVCAVATRYKPGIPRCDLPLAAHILRDSGRLDLEGCHMHVGRHRPDLAVWSQVIPCYIDEIASLMRILANDWSPRVIDVGGGFSPRRDPAELKFAMEAGQLNAGVVRGDEPRDTPTVADYAKTVCSVLLQEARRAGIDTQGVTLQLEPGRGIYANAGLHLASVTNLKTESMWFAGSESIGGTRCWIETDTSEAWLPDSNLERARWTVVAVAVSDLSASVVADVVGRSCGFEILVADARLRRLSVGEVLAFLDTGAYQDSGSSNFNAMPRPGTVLVFGTHAEVIKEAETLAAVFARDRIPGRLS